MASRTQRPPASQRRVTMVDSRTTPFGHPSAPAHCDPAIGGALFAGFLVGRVWTMAAKAIRSSHVELHNL